jgi:hypothetical protein
MALGKKNDDTTTRLTPDERDAMYAKMKQAAIDKALQGEKVRYKSTSSPERFKAFLEHRLTIWDELKDKTFHGKRMYNKTKEILANFESSAN